MSQNRITATIIAAHGRHYLAEPQAGGQAGSGLIQAFPRGKRSEVAVGDRVTLEWEAEGQASIAEVLPRASLLYRSDQYRSKLLAANLDQVLVVLATEPGFSEDLLGRALVAAEALGIAARIVLNKCDLPDRLAEARERLRPYRDMGYQVLELSAKTAPDAALAALRPLLAGKASIMLGQSGMGKSTLLNLLVPEADAQTREISAKLDSGKHTTTFTRLYHLPQDWGTLDGTPGSLVDSPGFQEFGLHHLTEGMLERAFVEFRPALGHCRFTNCHHLKEPDCAVLQAVAAGRISARRHALYAQLLHESNQQKPY